MSSELTKEEILQQIKEYTVKEEFKKALRITEAPKVSFLAQGEYNINYLLETSKEKFVLRLNTGSQMHLDNQIKYEYQALEYLVSSNVTPTPLLLDDSCEELPFGLLVMSYLPGRSLVYERDLIKGAKVLANVHQVSVPKENQLIVEEKPLSGIWEECSKLIPTYLESSLGKIEVKRVLNRMINDLDKLRNQEEDIMNILPFSIVNTEVNSGNFIIDNDKGYLVDWEKPLVTTPLQDLSHFMVPTTTLWKTDYRMTKEDRECFIKVYCQERGFGSNKFQEIKEALDIFDKYSTMRGISWSAMAWVEYQQPDRLLKNQYTFEKMDMYLQEEFLVELFSEFE
ncbi:aminoglycoside phosphotransferase family protein [Selenihalanaerobacter shriftii]|uniref:Ser/Thr protein kinase RdoA involved in Cpx stress response, MazF antagonist n=1 Tax=Selenihalanaerobacter shriftii TaxID=142842 RepID=A0A1T4K5F5_9FIRM|nr:aminoglycoside phosphotransferase family protein [Selenihalanaerobacter shriftii]SJZ37688.1 Ser/Thr protein kinase RdoA involved in Cpx stress response, MazF antagonist [Selenihalanaerobacter shriftii]